jgi:hypothetical protein
MPFLALAIAGAGTVLAQDVDPEVAAQWDTEEMKVIVRETRSLETSELLQLVEASMADVEARLLEVPPSLRREWGDLVLSDDGGVDRVLADDLYDRVVPSDWGCAHFNFSPTRHQVPHAEGSDFRFNRGQIQPGGVGNSWGLIIALDGIDVRTATLDDLPDRFRHSREALAAANRNHPPREALTVAMGRTYAIRTFSHYERERVAVLKILAKDERGLTFAWRRIHEVPPKLPQR